MGRDALKVIGLTGRYCAGKSSIARALVERGVVEIDVDALGHTALNASVDELRSVFSDAILDASGNIDRRALGEIVFGNENQLRRLEAVVHPRMVGSVKAMIEQERVQGTAAVVVNAALLHRMHLDVLCDTICFVKAPIVLRFLRAHRRDGIGLLRFLSVQKAQRDITVHKDSGNGTVQILWNRGSEHFIHRQVDELCISIGI